MTLRRGTLFRKVFMMKSIIMMFFILTMPLTSQALVEVRAGYGVNTLDDDDYAGSKFDNMTGFNLDVIFEPPLLTDLGLGVRYESMGFDAQFAGVNIGDSKMDRVAALINYRIIDFVAYLGVIGTIGVSTDFETTFNGVKTKWDDKINYSVGVEGGMNLGIFSVGAELGKFFGTFENSGSADLDLDSVYVKFLVGLDF
jgi:hypothetical protein